MTCASREILNRGEKVNVSRLSIMSGLHRRDVMRLQGANPDGGSSLGTINRIIGQWCNDSRFSAKGRKPKTLSYGSGSDQFTTLVHSVSQDLHPGTILFELSRRELVKRDENSVTLLKGVLDSREDDKEGLHMLAEDTYDLALAVTDNLGSVAPKALHSKTEFDAIPATRADEVRRWFLKKGEGWQKEVSAYLASLDIEISGKRKASGPYIRAAFGMFGVLESKDSTQVVQSSPQELEK
jgi:hypothetical protein